MTDVDDTVPTTRPPRRRGRGEDGASLMIAVALLAFLGVLGVSILTLSYSNFKTTTTVRTAHDKLYAADGGLEVGLGILRNDSTYCASGTTNVQTLPAPPKINGQTVSVTCQAQAAAPSSSSSGSLTYSLITTGYAVPSRARSPNLSDAIDTSNSAGKGDLRFGGPAFNAGGFKFSGNGPRLVFDSTLDQYNAPSPYCADAKNSASAANNPSVVGSWTCKTNVPVPDPLPTLKVPPTSAPASRVVNGCTILYPGKYTTMPTFSSSGKYYLASGVYYFENAGTMTLNGQVFGGAPASGEAQRFTTHTPCSTDAAANALVPNAANGTGVQLVLGGNSSITVANSTQAKVELFARVPLAAGSEGTPRVSIYAPRTAGTGYMAWNSAAALSLGNAKPQIVVHGAVYIPNSPLQLIVLTNAGARNSPMFLGGLVSQSLSLKTVGSLQFTSQYLAGPNTPATPTSRTVMVTATASSPTEGGAPVRVRAIVMYAARSSAPPAILSWRKL